VAVVDGLLSRERVPGGGGRFLDLESGLIFQSATT
jgi:hypothetical protein